MFDNNIVKFKKKIEQVDGTCWKPASKLLNQ